MRTISAKSIFDFCQKVIERTFLILLFLVPLILTPWNSELFEFNKMLLTYFLTAIIAAAWLLKMILGKQIIWRKTFLDIPLLFFLFSQLISTIFSLDRHTSIWGYYSRFNGGLLSLVSYCLLFWAFVANFESKKIPLPLLPLTIRAETEEIQAMGENPVARLSAHLLAEVVEVDEVGVRYLFALGTDDMGVRKWLVPVVPVAAIGKSQLQHLVQFLEKGDGLVHRGQARCGEFSLDLLINLLHRGVPLALGQGPQHEEPLGGYAEIVALEPRQHLRHPSFRRGRPPMLLHHRPPN